MGTGRTHHRMELISAADRSEESNFTEPIMLLALLLPSEKKAEIHHTPAVRF